MVSKINKILPVVLILIIISTCIIFGSAINVQAQDGKPLTFPDPALEASIRKAIDKLEGLIYTADVQGLLRLFAAVRDIADIAGLEYYMNLKQLDLQISPMCDLSPIASTTTSQSSLSKPTNYSI